MSTRRDCVACRCHAAATPTRGAASRASARDRRRRHRTNLRVVSGTGSTSELSPQTHGAAECRPASRQARGAGSRVVEGRLASMTRGARDAIVPTHPNVIGGAMQAALAAETFDESGQALTARTLRSSQNRNARWTSSITPTHTSLVARCTMSTIGSRPKRERRQGDLARKR